MGIVKTENLEEESWKKEGSFEELLREFSSYDESIFSMLKTSSKPYKWGIYVRPPLKTLFTQKITLFSKKCKQLQSIGVDVMLYPLQRRTGVSRMTLAELLQ